MTMNDFKRIMNIYKTLLEYKDFSYDFEKTKGFKKVISHSDFALFYFSEKAEVERLLALIEVLKDKEEWDQKLFDNIDIDFMVLEKDND